MLSASKLTKTKITTLLIAAGLILVLVLTLSAQRQTVATSGSFDLTSRSMTRLFPNERPPRDDQVAAQAAGIKLGDSAEEIAALNEWYGDFYAKNEKSGPNPVAYEKRMADLAEAEAAGVSPNALNLGAVGEDKMLMIPFEFTGEDTIATCDADGNPVVDSVIEGPLHGTIPDPSTEGDNNTIWTDDFSIEWYQNLMFGDGVGVVRTDLNDGAGVDLTGVSAKNWYEEQSEGFLTIDGDIYPNWVQLDRSVAWYGWDADEINPEGTGYPCDGTSSGWGFEFMIDAANQLNEDNPDFDWAQYDTDGDQIVDHLMGIHAGVDNSAGGGTYGNYQIWAHSWDVYCDKGDGFLTYGCQVEGMDTPDDDTDDIYIGNYTVIPEDADIGVVVHEYGHDIGLPDLYDQTGATSNSTAHWLAMSAGSWSGDLGGSHPTAFNPWARYFFGWSDPKMISYDDPAQSFMIGQADPTPADTEDSVWIGLPNQAIEIENLAGDGAGLHSILGNQVVHSLYKDFDLSLTTTPVFTFTTFFQIEEDWDYTYVSASTDGGATWDILLNEEGEYATTDPNGSFAWWGEGGLTGEYEGALTYDLSAYNGEGAVTIAFDYATDQAVQDPGIWIDNLTLTDDGSVIYENDLEDASDWTNTNWDGGPGWEAVPYNEFYSHYYMLEWRNDEGSIASRGLAQNYYSLAHEGDGWMVDKFSSNVPGLLVWYRNNRYDNNQAVNGGREFAPPATGPKGELLLVDSHHDPIVWSGGWWDKDAGEPAQAFSNRRSAMDGAFTLDETPAWMIHDYADSANDVMDFGSRPAVSAFHDSMRSVPGWVFPGDGFVYRADRSASVVIAGSTDYSTRIRALADDEANIGDDLTGFWGFTVGGQVLGSGNPGDSAAQYGIHVEITEQADDGSYGVVNFWNKEFDTAGDTDYGGFWSMDGQFVYLYQMNTAEVMIKNQGGLLDKALVVVEVPGNLDYAAGSVSEGWVGVSGDDAMSISQALTYVKANGYDDLLLEPEPDNVRYFAKAYEFILTSQNVTLSYDYMGAKIGTAGSAYLVDHAGGGTFGMEGALPDVMVKPVTFFMPITPGE